MSDYEISIVENPPKLDGHANDTLFRCERDGEVTFVRARVTLNENESAFINAVAADVLTYRFQCSLCDETGDVLKDANGTNLLLSAENHGVMLDALEQQSISLDAWLAEIMEKQVRASLKKAWLLRHFVPRHLAKSP